MSDLRELYQELILEHSKPPRNYRKLPVASHQAEGYNPLCGYHFMVYLDVEGDSIREIAFEVSGCAISKASASMMTQKLKGKSREDAERRFVAFHRLVTGKQNGDRAELGKLAVFSDVSEFLCALSARRWRGTNCRPALEEKPERVSTEWMLARQLTWV